MVYPAARLGGRAFSAQASPPARLHENGRGGMPPAMTDLTYCSLAAVAALLTLLAHGVVLLP